MKTTDDLHTFLNAAAGEGLELDGVDAANLYASVFPERYKAATPPTASLEQDNYDSIWNALHRIDSAAAMLPTYTVDHEGGIEAFTQNIVDAITRLAQPTASNAGEREVLELAEEALGWHAAGFCEDSMPELTVTALNAIRAALATKPPAGEQIYTADELLADSMAMREALRKVKYQAASLADAQVIALEALTAQPEQVAQDSKPLEQKPVVRRLGVPDVEKDRAFAVAQHTLYLARPDELDVQIMMTPADLVRFAGLYTAPLPEQKMCSHSWEKTLDVDVPYRNCTECGAHEWIDLAQSEQEVRDREDAERWRVCIERQDFAVCKWDKPDEPWRVARIEEIDAIRAARARGEKGGA